jgi:hypothetical protein
MPLAASSANIKCRNLQVSHSSTADAIDHHAITTQAARGIVCVVLGGSRLVVFDAEDDPDNNEEDQSTSVLENSDDSDDHDEADI